MQVTKSFYSVLRSLVCAGLVLLACSGAGSAWAQAQYVQRNDVEAYLPYVLSDGLGVPEPGVNRLLEAENARRYLALSRSESRLNRPFWVDFYGHFAEPCPEFSFAGQLACASAGYPIVLSDAIVEAYTYEPMLTLQFEAYGGGKLNADWELAGYLAARTYVGWRTTMPEEFKARFLATRKQFLGLNPFHLGLYAGPELKAVGLPVTGFTLGTFVMASMGAGSLTRLALDATGNNRYDPFQSQFRLEAAQTQTLLKKRLTLHAKAGMVLRRVNYDTYYSAFDTLPPRLSYVDLMVSASALVQLPLGLKLNVSGQVLPYHAPDPKIIRWYRADAPEFSTTLQYKIAIFDMMLGYTLSAVAPIPDASETYPDTGGLWVPGAIPAQRLSFTLALRL